MLSTLLNITVPIFLIIGAGYSAARFAHMSQESISGLLSFISRFAAPAVLFYNMYQVDLSRVFEVKMLLSFYSGAAVSFILGIFLGKFFKRRPGEQVSIAFSCYFSNSLLMGLIIVTRAYGEESGQLMLGIIAIHAPLLYTIGMIAMEISRQDGQGAVVALHRAGKNIISTGLIIGIALGLALNILGIRLPEMVDNAVDMFQSVALPTALFAIGAALTRYKLQDDLAIAIGISVITLLIFPLVVFGVSQWVFDLPKAFYQVAVLVAAMPTGLNGYIFASMYQRAEGAAAGAILLSTALSIASINLWLLILGTASP